MSRITEAHRLKAELPDADLYDLTSDDEALLRSCKAESRPTFWPICRGCDAPFPADAPNTLFCGNCRLSEQEL